MQRALILGGKTGLLGQALVYTLQRETTWEIACLGRQDGPLFDEDFLKRHIDQGKYDVIFNTVAFTQVDDAEDNAEEAHRLNCLFPEMLAGCMKPQKTHLIQYSTDFVYGSLSHAKEPRSPWRESDMPTPESIYGKTKRACEETLLAIYPNNTSILRTAWLFGPWKKNFVATILNAAQNKKELTVVADQIGSPTYTLDLAKWSIAIASNRATGIWHCVNTGSASWYELAKKSVELAQIDCLVKPIKSDEWPQKAKRPPYSVLDSTKLAHFLSKPIRKYDDALSDYILSFIKNKRNVCNTVAKQGD